MNDERAKRYRDKLNLISERIDDAKSWTGIGSAEFISDKKTKLATYKACQELIEASMDVGGDGLQGYENRAKR